MDTPPFEYIADFIDEADRQEMFVTLLNELEWVHKNDTLPRKEYYVHALGLPYQYGSGAYARTYESQPDHPVIAQIRQLLKDKLGFESDVVFLNRYDTLKDHLGWHADDSPEMSHDHPIVSVSLGAERALWVKSRSATTNELVCKFMLGHGSAFVMKPGMQRTHLHRIPKHDRECGVRISLTFRKYVRLENDEATS